MKSDQFFSGDKYFPWLKLTPTKKLYQLFFFLNKNQIVEVLKKLSDLWYHNLVEWRWVGNGSWKRERYGSWSVKMAADQSKLASHTDSSSEEKEDFRVEVNFDESIDLAIH